jgi:hypothetical protein
VPHGSKYVFGPRRLKAPCGRYLLSAFTHAALQGKKDYSSSSNESYDHHVINVLRGVNYNTPYFKDLPDREAARMFQTTNFNSPAAAAQCFKPLTSTPLQLQHNVSDH